MTNKSSGMTYCYGSSAERRKGMKMREAFSKGWKMTKK